ncbi:ABSCISIC ACID-INSENSITIVE 5-like protein 5 isoform X2 [Quercus suber]|uniref:ABSCISIC ACID-INSENSITIVE 5-like protein 5 isoform X2 n=1 Tax=Quercus suber TaxID=58331 RepID=UPI0032DEB20F
MASSKVVATTNPDLPRQSSICSLSTMLADLQQQQQQNQSMNMDDLLKNLYSTSSDQFADGTTSAGGGGGGAGGAGGGGDKTVDEVWKEIVAGTAGTTTNADNHSKVEEISGSNGNNTAEEMTLEDFLTKAGAVREEDVRLGGGGGGGALVPGGYAVNGGGGGGGQFGMEVGFDGRMVVGGGGVSAVPVPVPVPVQVSVVGGGGGGGGRGKRRAIEEPLLDKATQQKQRRMIKNRESAARSRERKQAYTVELETLVTNLEEENAKLLKEEADHQKERFELLMQNLIPVVEKRKPRRALRRVNSVCW